MKNILLFVFFLIAQSAISQVTLDGDRLVKDGMKYKFSKYEEVFQNPEAKVYIKKARTNKTFSEIFAVGGGVLIGYGAAGLLLRGGEIKTNEGIVKSQLKSGGWGYVGAGLGLVGIGIPLAIGVKKNAEKAIAIENGESVSFQPYFKIETAGNGLALSYNF